MTGCGSWAGCGVMEWVKRSTLRWFGHIERMGNEDFLKVYLGSAEGTNRRGRSLGRWKDRVKEYMSERGVRGSGLEGSAWIGRGGDPVFCYCAQLWLDDRISNYLSVFVP